VIRCAGGRTATLIQIFHMFDPRFDPHSLRSALP
jgi:hypothetical protein